MYAFKVKLCFLHKSDILREKVIEKINGFLLGGLLWQGQLQ